jgi:hypothetical protein
MAARRRMEWVMMTGGDHRSCVAAVRDLSNDWSLMNE